MKNYTIILSVEVWRKEKMKVKIGNRRIRKETTRMNRHESVKTWLNLIATLCNVIVVVINVIDFLNKLNLTKPWI